MHELSIAEAIEAQARLHAPPGGRIRSVEIRVGALRGLERTSLEMCWQAVTQESPLAGSELVVEMLPWQIDCPSCGRSWTSPVPFVTCSCGEERPNPTASDELDLISMTVEEEGED